VTAHLNTNSLSNEVEHSMEIKINSQLQNKEDGRSRQNSIAETVRNSANDDAIVNQKKGDSIHNIELGHTEKLSDISPEKKDTE